MKKLSVLLLLVLFSCKSDKQPEKENVLEAMFTIDCSKSLPLELRLSDLCEDVELVPLEATDDFLVGEIEHLKYAYNHFFVLDDSESLYVFDRNGRGRTILNHKGQGPREYLDARSLDLTTDSLICLLTYPPKLMYYTLEGSFVRELRLGFQGFELSLLSDGQAAVYRNNVDCSEKSPSSLIEVVNLFHNVSKSYLPGYSCMPHRMLPSFQQNRVFTETENGETLFGDPLSNEIIGLDSTGVYVKYRLDFGRRNPDKYMSARLSDPSSSVVDFVQKQFPVYGFNSCWENSHYMYVQYFDSGKLQSLLYDKKRNLSYKGGILMDDLTGCNPRFLKATDEFLVAYWTAGDIISLADYLQMTGKDKDINPQLAEMISIVEKTGNPVMGIYKFKR